MKKNAIITLRCGAEQKQKIEKCAEQQGQSTSEYILDKTLHASKRKINKKRMEETEIKIMELMTLINKLEAGIDVRKEIIQEAKEICYMYK